MKTKNIIISFILISRILVIFLVSENQKNKNIKNIDMSENTTINIATTWGGSNFLDTNKEKKTKIVSDIEALKKIYINNKSESVLVQIIEKQVQNYQFNDAIENIQYLKNPEEVVDPKLFTYIAINSSKLKINNPESIDIILQIIDTYKKKNLMDKDDVIFYNGLKEIWNTNYNQWLIYWEAIQKNEYISIIKWFKEAINQHKAEKSIPEEYKDGLVALAALKNGYFTIARKIAIVAINKNEKYILPYQILAYSHFLSNNRETAIEYFLKLRNFDENNKDMYNFLIWVAYYRNKEYSSSTVYLKQVQKTNKTDTLRYLIQDYQELQAVEKEKETRNLLAKQNDISPSDFYLYFYNILFKSYFSMDQKTITEYKELSSTMLENCKNRLPENDICTYGEFAKAALEETIKANEYEYIQLAQKYNTSYLFHILWDYFSKNNDTEKAEQTYAKAVALTEDGQEEIILKEKLNKIKNK